MLMFTDNKHTCVYLQYLCTAYVGILMRRGQS